MGQLDKCPSSQTDRGCWALLLWVLWAGTKPPAPNVLLTGKGQTVSLNLGNLRKTVSKLKLWLKKRDVFSSCFLVWKGLGWCFQDYREATKTPWQQTVPILGESIFMRQDWMGLCWEHFLTDEQQVCSKRHQYRDHKLLPHCLLLTHRAINVTPLPARCPHQPTWETGP